MKNNKISRKYFMTGAVATTVGLFMLPGSASPAATEDSVHTDGTGGADPQKVNEPGDPAGNMKDNPFRLARMAVGPLTQLHQAKDVFIAYRMLDGKNHYIEFDGVVPQRICKGNRFAAFGWADYFPNDPAVLLPLLAKYGFSNSFYVQEIPKDTNFLEAIPGRSGIDTQLMQLIFNLGSQLENHCWFHWAAPFAFPFADGYHTPSNHEMRTSYSNGTNIFGRKLTEKIKDAHVMTYWLNSDNYKEKSWGKLSDHDCDDIRSSIAWIRVPRLAGTGSPFPKESNTGTRLLECLDFLSNRYLGTTGYGRIPEGGTDHPRLDQYGYPKYTDTLNLKDGKVAGGIFQGASTTNNHEIYERIIQISKLWASEVHHQVIHQAFHSDAGGIHDMFHYKDPLTGKRYYDAQMKIPANIHSKLQSSLFDEERSFYEILVSGGYKLNLLVNRCSGGHWKSRALFNEHVKMNGWLGKCFNQADKSMSSYHRYIIQGILSGEEMEALRKIKNALGWRYDHDGQDKKAMQGGFYHCVNTLVNETAWGLIPLWADDASYGRGAYNNENIALFVEMRLMFCKMAGIEVVGFKEAWEISQQERFLDNYFPNHRFEQSINEYINPAILTQKSADGWIGDEAVVDFDETIKSKYLKIKNDHACYIRQYHLKYGELKLSVKARGKGTLSVYYLLNKTHPDIPAEPDLFREGIKINSEKWRNYEMTITIEQARKEDTEDDYISLNGFHNQVCGLQFTLKASALSTVMITHCTLK